MDDRLDLMDQGSFLGLRALGHQPCTYLTWVYDRPVDLDALERFNERLAGTLLGRLVQPSPVPGGRHRWVALDAVPPIEVEPTPRPRAAIQDWTDELGERGLDPEHGPGWRLGVLPLDDGGIAVTLATGHTLGDGMAKLQAIADAVRGVRRRPDHPVRGTVRRRDVLWSDLFDLVRSLPSVVRAVVAGVRVARTEPSGAKRGREWRKDARHSASGGRIRATRGQGGRYRAPAACVRVEQSAWDAAAERLGGTSNTLVAAFAATLAQRLGRTDAQGRVTLAVPVSTRVEGDTRGNALDSVQVVVDPSGLDRDLTRLRAATKAALAGRAGRAHDVTAVLPLVPLTPRFVVRAGEGLAMGSGSRPVGCSNHGDVDHPVLRIDGADPDDFWVRLAEPGQSVADLDRIGGQLYVLSGRALGRVYLSVAAHRVGVALDRGGLHAHVAAALADLGLTAAVATG
ncbi:hypothetical protein [Aeromicrobium sp. 179-A 4D2 NHS]|uniref:hypothetical protein n=1 Tax=Aeromicrobium sp. 179-A 4D2 NHS TaxID=3142375 RepID=UPI0039A32D1E